MVIHESLTDNGGTLVNVSVKLIWLARKNGVGSLAFGMPFPFESTSWLFAKAALTVFVTPPETTLVELKWPA
jgi:hypothetical protein